MKKPGAVSSLWNVSTVVLAGLVLLGGRAGDARAANVEVDGVILAGKPTWVVGSTPAANVAVNPGDVITWKAVSGTHGVVFNTQALAEAFLTFQTGGSLPALGPQTVMGVSAWGTAPQAPAGSGTLLAQATVKPGLAPGTTLGFFCSFHGPAMSGSFAVPAAASTIEVDGVILGGVPTWVVNGNPAANVAVKPGDTITWKAVSGTHGVVFNTQALAEAFLTFQTGGSLPALGPQTVKGLSVWGTAPQAPAGSGTLLAQATVKPGLAPGTTLGFFCSFHGPAMSGSLAGPGTTNTIEIDGVILQNGGPTWKLGNFPAANVPVKPGDSIVWKALPQAKHGVVFDTQALAEAFLSFQTGGGLPPLGPQTVLGEVVWGTAPQLGAARVRSWRRRPSRRGRHPARRSDSFAASMAAI